MPTNAGLKKMFSIPREPATLLTPGQYFSLKVPKGKKVIITDVYIDNQGGGTSQFQILEQRLPNSFELRYQFRTPTNQVTVINFSTGVKLGDEAAISDTIRIMNDNGSKANILVGINGVFVD